MSELAGDLTGLTAVVTAASRGIGFAIAEEVVRRGGRVVITGRKEDALAEAVDRLGGPDSAVGIAGRADDRTHQDVVVSAALEHFGSIDVLVNNAGINPAYGPMIDLDLSVARKIVETNCIAALAWAQLVHRSWMEEHGGAIVNVSSIASLRPAAGIGFYGASKAMLRSITEVLAVELGPGIRVNAVAPGVIKTKFAAALYEGREDEVAAQYPLRRLGVPDDVASVVGFLVSPAAAWVTGQTLTVDGGVTLTGSAE